ncbi:hypothetical protein [Streptococcus phage phiJH1301-3]|nr:hypothetical protein [Streptococcus phage phiJH1301-3]
MTVWSEKSQFLSVDEKSQEKSIAKKNVRFCQVVYFSKLSAVG